MPSTMIHLLVAYRIEPEADELFWIGNFAPDFTNDREIKRKTHMRKEEDRWAALERLSKCLDFDNPFEKGWFLHLFTDTCWDKRELNDFKEHYAAPYKSDDWFISYHQELRFVSDYLYNKIIKMYETME